MPDPETALALSYAPPRARAALEALFALDAALAGVLRTTREPLVGRMRLTWWHEALTALDRAPPPAEPVLRAVVSAVLPLGVSGAELALLVDGWEALLERAPPAAGEMALHAAGRGERLFLAGGRIAGAAAGDPLAAAGRGWSLADLARHLDDGAAARMALHLAAASLAEATGARWSRAGRALGALAHLAAMNLATPLDRPLPAGSPRRVARLAWHRLTGR